jgi:hypothetical protein
MNDWFKKPGEVLSLICLFKKEIWWSIFCLVTALIIAHIYLSISIHFKLFREKLMKLFSCLIFFKEALTDELRSWKFWPRLKTHIT